MDTERENTTYRPQRKCLHSSTSFMLKKKHFYHCIYEIFFFLKTVLDKSIPNKKNTKIKFYHINLTLFLHMASHNPENCKKAYTQVMGFATILQRTDM